MKRIFFFIFILVAFISIMSNLSSCYYDNEEYLYSTGGACTDTVYSYNGRVAAIVNQNCAISGCHMGPSPEADISLEGYENVKNNAMNGNFYCSVHWSSGCVQMPRNASKLDNCTLLALDKWKENGYPEN